MPLNRERRTEAEAALARGAARHAGSFRCTGRRGWGARPRPPLWFLWLSKESWKLLKTRLSRFIHQPYPVICLSFSCPWVTTCFSLHLLQCYFSCLNFLPLKLPALTSISN